ncbi:hypothetical protein INT48_007794 [Thamnidium elegans]|uniref:Uncharacterized protein n=1 Tax=Thamnidium elegans TaxID=101142 RepID=A0A8H7SG72_9FUNG|nr:hypothetical protein INT48_007794 [Thamnidium elegans]
MKNKQKSRHEVRNKKYNYLPPSPPSQQKSLQDSHYQSSSSPVGRPPPVELEILDDISEHDARMLQDLKAFLDNSTILGQGQASSSRLLPSFIEEEGFDVLLFDDDIDNVSFDQTMNLFPSLSEKKS